MGFVTRFAPSPTGPLHLGHAYSALLAHDMARANNGQFLLRIEDIDQTRVRPQWEQQIYDDLHWLGVNWDATPLRQSDRTEHYSAALDQLWQRGLLYQCRCNRRDIAAALSAPQEGDTQSFGPDGPIYPGTCRNNQMLLNTTPRPNGVLRLRMAEVAKAHHSAARSGFCFTEVGTPFDGIRTKVCVKSPETTIGDIALSRKDFIGSYHLSVVLDDAAQGITDILRGEDLFEATKIHVILQNLLELPTPLYHHHQLIRDDMGKRLAKRDDARALRTYRAEGATPQDIRTLLGL